MEKKNKHSLCFLFVEGMGCESCILRGLLVDLGSKLIQNDSNSLEKESRTETWWEAESG